MTNIHDHGQDDALPFDPNDPELRALAEEFRVRHYHREHKHFIDIQLPEVSDEN